MIAGCPLPTLVQSYLSIGQDFGRGYADTGHQLMIFIDLLVPHVQFSVFKHQGHQMAVNDVFAGVFASHYPLVLLIVEYRTRQGLAIF